MWLEVTHFDLLRINSSLVREFASVAIAFISMAADCISFKLLVSVNRATAFW